MGRRPEDVPGNRQAAGGLVATVKAGSDVSTVHPPLPLSHGNGAKAMSTLTTKRPRVNSKRSARMLTPHLLRLTVGKQVDDYAVVYLRQELGQGCRAFTLFKLTGPEIDESGYAVLLGNGQDVHD